MKILVTGAAGFIGSHLSERLLKNGDQVIGLDNFDNFYDPAQKERNAAGLLAIPGFSLVRGDVCDTAVLENIFSKNKIDCIVHLAAKAGVRPSILNADGYMTNNVVGLTRLLDAAAKYGVKRFLFASSSSVYGNQEKTPFSETDDVGYPISPYAASKRSGELLCHAYHHLYGMEMACLRFFTVYGPRQRPDLAIHKFTKMALANQTIQLYGDGSTRRDYTYVADIVDGIEAIVRMPTLGYEIVNLGNGNPVMLLEMVQALEHALGHKIQLEFIEKQPGDVDQTHADIRKAQLLLGYQPKVSLDEGVRRFLQWNLSPTYES